MSHRNGAEAEVLPPVTPRPAGVADLGRYRGRTALAPVIIPPPRPDAELEPDRSEQSAALSRPVLVPDWNRPVSTPAPAAPRTEAGPRVIRRVRLRSVFKMVLGFSICTFVVVVGAGVLIWVTISTLGVVENVESLAEDLGWTDVHFDGPAMLRSAAIGGAILVVASTLLAVVFAEMFNLLSTITGGIQAEVGPPEPKRVRRLARREATKAARQT